MTIDDRAKRARDELLAALDEVEAPEFGAVHARQRRRRAAFGGVAGVALLAVAVFAVSRATHDDTSVRTHATVTATRRSTTTTEPSTATSTSVGFTRTVPTTLPPTTTTGSSEPAPSVNPIGNAPENVVAVRDDGALVRLRTDTGTVVAVLARKGDPQQYVSSNTQRNVITNAVMGPNGPMLYEACCENATRNMYVLGRYTQLRKLHGTRAAASPDGKYLAISETTSIDVFELASGKQIRSIDTGSARFKVLRLAMANDGRVAVEVPGAPGTTSTAIVELGAGAKTPGNVTFRTGDGFSYATLPSYLPDGRLVYADTPHGGAAVAPSGPPRLHVVTSDGRDLEITADLPFGVLDLAVCSTGHLLVTGSDHVVRSFDGKTWRDVARGYTAADW